MSDFEQVTAVNLGNGRRLPADMVVVGVGARANTGLFDGQLVMENGGIKVNGRMQASDASVYAVGDVAAFPVKLFGGDVRRLEHVDCARRTARHAVAAMLEGTGSVGHIDYLPFFYSRVFSLSWQFYGDNAGEAVHFGDLAPPGDGDGAAPSSARTGSATAASPARSSRAEPAGVRGRGGRRPPQGRGGRRRGAREARPRVRHPGHRRRRQAHLRMARHGGRRRGRVHRRLRLLVRLAGAVRAQARLLKNLYHLNNFLPCTINHETLKLVQTQRKICPNQSTHRLYYCSV